MWLIVLWGAAVPFLMAVDSGIRPETWTAGLGTGAGLLVVLVVLSFMWPRFTAAWTMGFAGGSAISLVAAPIAGYPMLDIGFAVQAVGALAILPLASRNQQRKQERELANHPEFRRQRIRMERDIKAGLDQSIVAPGEAHVLSINAREMAGSGMAMIAPGGPLRFTLSSGRSHVLERQYIKSVEPVEEEGSLPGTFMIRFTPHIMLYGISITPRESERENWLALNPEKSASS